MKVGRNKFCPCGSGKKFKKCCAQKSVMQKCTFSDLNPKTRGGLDKVFGLVTKQAEQESARSLFASLKSRVSKSFGKGKQSKSRPSKGGES